MLNPKNLRWITAFKVYLKRRFNKRCTALSWRIPTSVSVNPSVSYLNLDSLCFLCWYLSVTNANFGKCRHLLCEYIIEAVFCSAVWISISKWGLCWCYNFYLTCENRCHNNTPIPLQPRFVLGQENSKGKSKNKF